MNNPIKTSDALIARNTILNFLGQAIPLIVAIISIPFIIQGLGRERFGILTLAWGIIVYFSLFDLGLGRATTKFVSEFLGKGKIEKLPSIVWTSLFFNVLLGIVGGIVLITASPFLVERILNIPSHLLREAHSTFLILGACVPLMTSSIALRGVLEGCQRFNLVNAIKAPSNSLNFLIPALAIPFGLRLPGIVFLLLVAKLGTAFAYLVFCLKVIPQLKESFSVKTKLMRTLFSFGIWITVSNIIAPILVYLDRFLIGSLFTMEAVAFYTAPHEIVTKLWILPTSLMITIFPVFSSYGTKRNKESGILYANALKYLLLIMGTLILILALFAKEILQLWLGADFAQKSTFVFQILAIGVFVNSLARIPFSLIQGIGRPDITAKFHLLELPIYVGLAWFLIGKFGISGAALAWTLRVGLDAILLFGASWKLVPSTLPALAQNAIIRTAIAFLGLTVLTVLTIFSSKILLIKIFVLLGLITIFYIVIWKYALDLTEKRFIASLLTLFKMGSR